MNVFLLYWLPFLLYSTAILTLSSQSHLPGAEVLPDKWMHGAEYFFFAFLLSSALRRSLSRNRLAVICCLVFVWGALFAAFDEHYQSYIPGRQCSVYDWIADITGITAMISLLLWKEFRSTQPEYHEAS